MAIKTDASIESNMITELVIEDLTTDTVVDFAPDLGADIGVRLKLIRERNGLSQRELAKRAGITNSNISMIEQGLVSPSINSLAKVLNGIPMTLAHFFACDQVDIGPVIYPAEQLEAEQQTFASGIVAQTLAAEKHLRQLDMSRHIYPAGCDTGSEPLCQKSEFSGWVVTGQVELTAGMEVHELSEGDGFYLAALQPYRIRNRKDSAAIIVGTALRS